MSVNLIGLIAGSGWAAGVNLYAVVVLLGLLGRLGFADIPKVLTRTDVLAMAGMLYAVAFPVAALAAAVALLAASLFLAVKLWGAARRRWRWATLARGSG